MENDQSDKSNDEPNPKRPKIESGGSTSSKPKATDPFLSLPSDIFVKIIGFIPVAQWPSFELVDKNFRATTMIAYRQLRNLNVERDFFIKYDNACADRSLFAKFINSILQKFAEHSQFLTSLGGIYIQAVPSLAEFEHLQSISLGNAGFFFSQRGIQLENVVAFLESTRSRTSLKELRLYNVVQRRGRGATTIRDRFATSFVNGREIPSPLKLEKFSFASSDESLRIRLDTMDTSRLTELRVVSAAIEPQQLTNLIERASELRIIEISFLDCGRHGCNGPHLQANKKLLTALASREKLTALNFDFDRCTDCACMHFIPEFFQMLKDIGRRGQLRKLAIETTSFEETSTVDSNKICATILNYIPYLQSIKLHMRNIGHGNIFNIVSLPELEEIDLTTPWIPISTNSIKKIAQLPRLRRLALRCLSGGQDPKSFEYLANVTTLKDLRIGNAKDISVNIWEKWADGFGSNLECLMLHKVRDEDGLIRLLEKAVRLRVLILQGCVTDQSLKVIAQSCPNLETLGVQSNFYLLSGVSVWGLQEVVNHCPKLNRLGGFKIGIDSLQLAKFRKIVVDDVDVEFWNYDFDEVYD